jgi:hypothetical protein
MKTIRRTSGWLAPLAIATIVVIVGLAAAPAHAEDTSPRSAAQLEQLVAPIALYPDPLLAQLLMASTYPLEVVEAARWSQENSGVIGEALEDAMQTQPWDPSIKALTAVPQTLQMMNDKLDWMQALGDAFLARQQAVLDAIQRLRARADAAGNLETTPQQKVARVGAPPEPGSTAAPETVYTIEPATADEYYVPIYDPNAVYGAWSYPEYPPFTWYPPGYVAGSVLSFATGVSVGWAIWGRVDWWQHRVNIIVNRFNRFNHTSIKRNAWVHDPAHRGNVPYRDSNVAARFGDEGKVAAAREASRDKSDAGRRDRGERAKSGDAKSGDAKSDDAKSNDAKSKSARTGRSARSKEGGRSKQRHAGGSRGGGHRGARKR